MRSIYAGAADATLGAIERKMSWLTHDIPTYRIERMPISMQEDVVGVPPAWIRLLRKVARLVICYREAVDADEAPTSP